MKKKYEGVSHVISPTHELDVFDKHVRDQIKFIQNKGLEVEVQYQLTDTRMGALVLGYRMVNE